MPRLDGKKIAVTGARRFEELRKLIENLGGIALSRPAQGTIYLVDDELKENLKSVMKRPKVDWFILTTCSGLETLISTANEMDMERDFIEMLNNSRIAARGYKTVSVLKNLGLNPAVRDDDGTTDGLIRELSAEEFEGRKVAIQLHGEPIPKLTQWLEKHGAEYIELMPYRHTSPDDQVMQTLVREITHNEIHAVAFTTASQVRSAIDWAKKTGLFNQVIDAFNHRIFAAAVGKVTTEALIEAGIERVVVPAEERMGSMIVELAKQFSDSNQ